MELSQQEIGLLGKHKSVFESETNLKILKSSDPLFGCMTFVFKVENAYKRCAVSLVENDEVKITSNRTSFLCPTYACKEASFHFISGHSLESERESLLKELGDYLTIEGNTIHNFKLKIKDDKQLIMFDFLPHNNGIVISIITRQN
jgi:hypothetical protein